MKVKRMLRYSEVVVGVGIIVAAIFIATTVFAVTTSVNSAVTVGNSSPTVTSVVTNNGSAITLTANATTTINLTAIVSDSNGCTDITAGTTTILLYRTGVTSSTCYTTANNRNCYRAVLFTASSTCAGGTVNTTTSIDVFFFADATDSSSSFPGSGWRSTVIFKDPANATGSGDSPTVTLNTLTAINVTTSSINYGTVGANSDTGATNQTSTVANAGNSSSTLQVAATATLTSGANSISTSSQKYATTTFTYSSTGNPLSASNVTIPGFFLLGPSSTAVTVSSTVFWGLGVPNATPTGTYSGTTLFTAVFSS